MKKFAVVFAVLSMFSTLAQAEGNPEAGKAKAVTCIACHGADGNSPIEMYPKIAGQHTGYLVKQLMEFRQAAKTGGQEGRNDPIMSGMAMALSDEDIADVSAYFASQAISEGPAADAAVQEKGHQLYMGGDASRQITACVACHGVKGEGMGLAGYPALADQHPAYLKAQLEKFRSGDRNNDMNGMMAGVAKNLSDEDIAILAQYISAIE
ncbi:c-type cytochrome [Ferrimonas balearica]|uniref:c-type cytochrome n=1 Tax=Ferrimonas balearica TaxID=44012 RepID=UPI001C55BF64|nr:c-type cytochrome [Ferrimonas balearica]MBW3141375.1 cytochrome c4 [Ferrimonas balearica]MBW3166459.1 cytochrome c4 [Ferrimonas balearica]MBY6108419.1 cytochrome c4 [Ferrimonas balearica]